MADGSRLMHMRMAMFMSTHKYCLHSELEIGILSNNRSYLIHPI